MTSEEIDEIRTLIEKDLEWRIKELAFLSSMMNSLSHDPDAERKGNVYRKVLVLSMYSHFEGFFRNSFEIYAHALNDARIQIHQAIDILLASSMHETFNKYDIDNKWVFPTDDVLGKQSKRLYNRLYLLQNIISADGFVNLPITTSTNSIIYTESNLTPHVIDKILYSIGIHKSLGVDQSEFMRLMGVVKDFVAKRNGLAHGDNKNEFKEGVGIVEYNKFKLAFDSIVALIPPIITKALENKLYMKETYR